jgi:transposase
LVGRVRARAYATNVCSEKRVIQQAFRFELDPNRAQRVLLAKSVGASRYVYNWGLAESRRQYELTGKRPRLGDLKNAPKPRTTTAPPSASARQAACRATAGRPAIRRGLARKQRGSANRERAKLRRARLYYRIYCQRRDVCSGCGTIKDRLGLGERVYDCHGCGFSLDRDGNAAINLRRLAELLAVDRREETPVERTALAAVSTVVKPVSVKQEGTAGSACCSTRRSTRKQVLVRV